MNDNGSNKHHDEGKQNEGNSYVRLPQFLVNAWLETLIQASWCRWFYPAKIAGQWILNKI